MVDGKWSCFLLKSCQYVTVHNREAFDVVSCQFLLIKTDFTKLSLNEKASAHCFSTKSTNVCKSLKTMTVGGLI